MQESLFKEGLHIDIRDKDTIRRATSCWIAELGEIETTFRSDLEFLKAFITMSIDTYRVPYGRLDVSSARRTSFIGTCNTGRFLIDPTGSRRFWTVPVSNIDLDALSKLDILQLWKQIELDVEKNRQGFRLSDEERTALMARNTAFEKPLKAQEEIEDILSDAKSNPNQYDWKLVTISEFKTANSQLNRYDVSQIGRALNKLGIPERKPRIDGKQVRVRQLPMKRYVDIRGGIPR